MWVLHSRIAGVLLKSASDSSRILPSSKTHIQCVDDYDSDLDDEGSATGIPANDHPLSAWCANPTPHPQPQTYSAPCSIPEDPLPTYNAPAPALVLKSGTAKT